MLLLAFGFLALAAVLEFRARAEALARPAPGPARAWAALGTACGVVAVVGPLVVMWRIGPAQGAGAYLLGMLFAFAAGFVPPRHAQMVSMAAGVFGLGLLAGALLR